MIGKERREREVHALVIGSEQRDREMHEATLHKIMLETSKLKEPERWHERWREIVVAAVAALVGLVGTAVGNRMSAKDLDTAQKNLWEVTQQAGELEAKRASLAQEMADLAKQRQRLLAEKDQLERQKAQVESQLASLTVEFARFDEQVKSGKPADSRKANEAIMDSALPQVAQAPPISNLGRDEAIEGLFSMRAGIRLESYKKLMDGFGADPALPAALIDYARKNLQNDNGIYNTLVAMSHMRETALLAADKAKIRAFASEVSRPDAPRITERASKLLERLDGR